MSSVRLLVVTGNLRHRIEKLGCEKRYEDMTEDQRILHDAAKLQGLNAWGADLDPMGKPERPLWANQAFVYLLPEHAACIEQAVRHAGKELQSKHILVSEELKETLERTLGAKPEGGGREGVQLRRAGEISQEEGIPLFGYTFEDLHKMRKGEADAGNSFVAPAAPRATATTPVTAFGGGAEWGQWEEWGRDNRGGGSEWGLRRREPPPPPPPPPRRTGRPEQRRIEEEPREEDEVHMLQIDKDQIMGDRAVPEDLLEYLTAPPTVQILSPETWLDVWQHVCRENQEWLEMRDDPRCGPCPYCRMCKRWAALSHLRSEGCESRRREEGVALGHVLAAILEAENKRVSAEQPTRADGSNVDLAHGAGICASWPTGMV